MTICSGRLVAVLLVAAVCAAAGQAPQLPQGGAQPGPAPAPREGSASKPPVPSARITGRVLAEDTGKPLRRANVTLMALPSKQVRIAVTDGDGRYEFSGLEAGRYNVSPSKPGYVVIGPNPFDAGRGLDVADGQTADRTDFMMPRGSVISGRITDEFGEPVANVMVQAARYQFRPSGQRQLTQGSSGNYFMPAATNDLGEFRIFGLRPGSYFVSARAMDMSAPIALAQSGGPGLGALDSRDGLTITFFPGTANVAEAQTVQVGLMHEASASFTLVPARMSRISGTVVDAQGRGVSGARLLLRSTTGIVGGWFGNASAQLSPEGRFTLANVAPGEYILDVRPNAQPGASPAGQASPEFASVPVSVGGDDIDLTITTTSGISVSGKVIFEGASSAAQRNLRISAASEEDGRNFVSWSGPEGGQVDADGQFHIPAVFGNVVFRTGPLPQNVMLKAVILNGADITNTPFDATGTENVTNLQVVLTDKQGRISGVAKNLRGEVQYNYRLVVYPAVLKDGDIAVRFQHNTSPSVQGQFSIGRMPPGEYVGLAVKGVQPGEEWDPDLRKRVEQLGKRFTLSEGEALQLEMPYVE